MTKDDLIRLRHMLDAAREAVSYTEAYPQTELNVNRMLLHSLVRCITIIGEAAASVSAEGRAEMPAIPWTDIVGMRNRLIHAYFDINLELVWDTVKDDLAPLVVELEKVVSPLDS